MRSTCSARRVTAWPRKELQRQLGVSYPTALRMAHLIREHMADVDGEHPLSGIVEADETYVGGRVKGKGRGYKSNKAVVFGMTERGGGRDGQGGAERP